MSQLQVCQKLGLVNGQQFFYGFQFQDDFGLDQEIDLVPTVQLQALVLDWEVDLPLKAQPPKAKLVAKALLISRFQETRTELAMNLKRRAENWTRPRVPRFFFVFPGRYVNRMKAVAHRTISTQNHSKREGKRRGYKTRVPEWYEEREPPVQERLIY